MTTEARAQVDALTYERDKYRDEAHILTKERDEAILACQKNEAGLERIKEKAGSLRTDLHIVLNEREQALKLVESLRGALWLLIEDDPDILRVPEVMAAWKKSSDFTARQLLQADGD